MNNPVLKREVSNKQNKMLKQINSMLRESKRINNNLYDSKCLIKLNFEDDNSSQDLKAWVSSPCI